jgi:hypothetical protein
VREVLDAVVVRQWCRPAAGAPGRTREEIDALNVGYPLLIGVE